MLEYDTMRVFKTLDHRRDVCRVRGHKFKSLLDYLVVMLVSPEEEESLEVFSKKLPLKLLSTTNNDQIGTIFVTQTRKATPTNSFSKTKLTLKGLTYAHMTLN